MIFNGKVLSVCGDFRPTAEELQSIDTLEKAISANGGRTQYIKAFYEQDFSGVNFRLGLIKPNPSNAAVGSINQMFSKYKGTSLPTGIDFACSPTYQLKSGYANYLFAYASKLEEIPDMGIPILLRADRAFAYCYALKKIEVFRIHKTSTFSNTFDYCHALEEITIEGVIGQNGLNLSWSTKLSHDSLLNVLNCLEDKSSDTSGTTWKVTLGSANLAKLTASEKAIATKKGWTLA